MNKLPLTLSLLLLVFTFNNALKAAVVDAHADTVQKVYIAYYGRPADPAGLDYWTNQLQEANGNLNEIIDAFGNSEEAKLLYGNLSDEAKVNTIYQQLFGRGSEPNGLAYYTNRLSSGASSHASIMLDILNGAQGDDASIVNNKLAISTAFTDGLDTSDELATYNLENVAAIRSWLSTVSASTNPNQFNTQIDNIPDVVSAGTTTTATGTLQINNPNTTDNQPLPVRNISYHTSASNQAVQSDGQTNMTGAFTYNTAGSLSFEILGQSFGPMTGQDTLDQHDLAASYCHNAADSVRCSYNVAANLQRTLLSIDDDQNDENGISLLSSITEFPAALDSSIDKFELALGKALLKDGRQTAALFKPSLGINLEEPQPEADDVGGQPIPFVDLFRIGRPFPEYSCSENVYDEYGWPVEIPESCASEEHPVLHVPSYATTLILRYVPFDTLPTGKYTVLYEGSGDIQYSGIGSKVTAESVQGRDIVEITPALLRDRAAAGLRVQIKDITAGDHIRNVRIVMPGGTCAGNPFIRVDEASECPSGAFESFVDRLEQDRNAIIFNPDFLRFLKDFKVIRTMNFMKASPRNPCFQFTDDAYRECILQEFTWEQRARMNDAMWGGSFRTDLVARANRGVPLEVTVELVNQLQRDPWFNLPHNATDDYIRQYATYVRDNLDSNLKAHIEYTNEPWNGPFWANPYTILKGKAAGLDERDYWAGLFYYTERAVEVFNIWQEVWGGTNRLVRVLNTQHNGGEFASRNMLNHKGAHQSIDVLASAPYFFGCWDRASSRCQDETAIPMVLTDITSVDDIFAIMDDPDNPYGMASTINYIKLQNDVAKEFDVDLYAYEGGQHLTVTWGDADVSTSRKHSLLDLFRAANRDPRMADRYSELLNGWKEHGAKLFTLYTMPQTYHTFGSFGIKEDMAQARDAAPKFDASMRFQEEQRNCWWDGCE